LATRLYKLSKSAANGELFREILKAKNGKKVDLNALLRQIAAASKVQMQSFDFRFFRRAKEPWVQCSEMNFDPH